jgi:hypothetical protein
MPTPPIPDCSLQPFALAFKSDLEYPADPIQAYRAYYRTEKSHLAQFTRRAFRPGGSSLFPAKSLLSQLSQMVAENLRPFPFPAARILRTRVFREVRTIYALFLFQMVHIFLNDFSYLNYLNYLNY